MSSFNNNVLYVFPGQGSQYKGMGFDLYQEFQTARRVYGEASDVLGYDVAELSFSDPDEQLNLTKYTQPALLTHQIACLEVFKELVGAPCYPAAAAGHSLGEYAALVSAEALDFAAALKLVSKRGELMGDYGEGEMLALPLGPASARSLAENHHCSAASYNLPNQTVVGGTGKDIAALAEEFSVSNPKHKAVRLQTEGAFHTYLMVSAAIHFRDVLNDVSFATPKFKVLSNYTGEFHEPTPSAIKSRLFFQLFNPVDWTGCLKTAMNDGAACVLEFGGGIGKSPEPEKKRPNLASIVKTTLRESGCDGLYFSAINLKSLREASDFFASPQHLRP
jgi:[acyl-carrier-protein] S-malonyltransferase